MEGIILSPSKFQFSQKEIKFPQKTIAFNDVKPFPLYLDSVRNFPHPNNIAEIHAWFQMEI